jgi:hypothetical protein
MRPEEELKFCLRNLRRAFKKYGVDFFEILKQVDDEELEKAYRKGKIKN